jgi:hypothetical protein
MCFESDGAAKEQMFDYIGVFYTRQREHDVLGCPGPCRVREGSSGGEVRSAVRLSTEPDQAQTVVFMDPVPLGGAMRATLVAVLIAGSTLPSPARAEERPGEHEGFAVAWDLGIGRGVQGNGAGHASGFAAIASLRVSWREVAVGPFVGFGGGEAGTGDRWGGVAVGWSHWLSEVARLTLLAEGGKHRKELNAEYGGGQVVDSASLAFVGARAGIFLGVLDLSSGSHMAFGKRVGLGLQVGLRTDLGRTELKADPATYDPSWGPFPAPVSFGGQTAWFAVSIGGEWW